MNPPLVVVDRRETFAIVTLNRQDKLNALSHQMMSELEQSFEVLETDSELRSVILTGAGERSFSAGTDITELAELTADAGVEVARRGQSVCDRIERFNVPVIAAVNGVAAGGGFELALACHMRLASTDAEFSLPEPSIGMIPAYGGTQRLSRIIGTGRALEVILTRRVIHADEAFRIGLVNHIVSKPDLLTECESIAREISKLAPLAIRACLEAVTIGLKLPIEEGLALEVELFSRLFASEDVREGTKAFVEKRPPVFTGA